MFAFFSVWLLLSLKTLSKIAVKIKSIFQCHVLFLSSCYSALSEGGVYKYRRGKAFLHWGSEILKKSFNAFLLLHWTFPLRTTKSCIFFSRFWDIWVEKLDFRVFVWFLAQWCNQNTKSVCCILFVDFVVFFTKREKKKKKSEGKKRK